jgi:hypothetical protein
MSHDRYKALLAVPPCAMIRAARWARVTDDTPANVSCVFGTRDVFIKLVSEAPVVTPSLLLLPPYQQFCPSGPTHG